MLKIYLYSLLAFIGLFIYNSLYDSHFYSLVGEILSPLLISTFLILFGALGFIKNNNLIMHFYAYILFFTISIFSYFGLAGNITGSHAASSNPLIYGLSFYTAYLGYLIFKQDLNLKKVLISANPIILISGPMPVIFNIIPSSLASRVKYYFPFLLIGFFFFKVISAPMTFYLSMLGNTSPLVILLFAVLFRIFLYFNFAGISLMAYGLMGIFGAKIPLNFTQPFSSRSVIEFWRSWHVALSAVLKTLFYDPVKKNSGSTYLAIFAVYISSAAWHGVSINFFYWGIIHALAFLLTIQLLKKNQAFLAGLLLILAIPFGDVMFTDNNIPRLTEKLINFTTIDAYIFPSVPDLISVILSIPKYVLASTGLALLIICIEFFGYHNHVVAKRNYKFLRTKPAQLTIYLLMFLLLSGQGFEYAAYGQR
jgi:alginate O-acetyltransferase complex protein AlgI